MGGSSQPRFNDSAVFVFHFLILLLENISTGCLFTNHSEIKYSIFSIKINFDKSINTVHSSSFSYTILRNELSVYYRAV